jgi:hypothetical protein
MACNQHKHYCSPHEHQTIPVLGAPLLAFRASAQDPIDGKHRTVVIRNNRIPWQEQANDQMSDQRADLAELYRQRWQVEIMLAHLKTTIQMDVLHGQTVAGGLKELTVFALVYNLVRLVMGKSAILQHLGVERISVVDALRWLGAPSTGTPLGALRVNPIRPHRVESRVKKRRPKPFPLMITPRHELRQQLIQPALSG